MIRWLFSNFHNCREEDMGELLWSTSIIIPTVSWMDRTTTKTPSIFRIFIIWVKAEQFFCSL